MAYGTCHQRKSSVPHASSHHILLRTEQLGKVEKGNEHDIRDGIAATWGKTEKLCLGSTRLRRNSWDLQNQSWQSKCKTGFEGVFLKTQIPSTRTGRSLMKLKGLKELDHVHYYTASGKLLKITHGVLETCRFKDKLTNSRSINTEWREAAGRNWLISVLQLLQMLRKLRQNRPTAGAQAHVLSLNSTSCCCCYKQNAGQGETLLSSESSSSTPAQN